MGTFPFNISAQLVATVQQDQVMIVAEENYIIVNFKDHAALERVMQNVMPPSSGKGGGILGAIEKTKGISRKMHQAGLVVDVRVNNKTYVEIGSSATPKLSSNAVIGKVGSWFSKG